MNRREFIMKTGLAILGGKVIYDVLNDIETSVHEYRIFNELPDHVYDVITTGNVNGVDRKIVGKGIVYDDKFLTCAHITDIGKSYVKTPFGKMSINFPVVDKKVSVNGNVLENLIYNVDNDIAVFTNRNPLPKRALPEDKRVYMEEPSFPCKPSSKRKLGDEIYLIGNPRLLGLNIRRGRICDLDGVGSASSKYTFGTDINATLGDSGTPVVSKDFKLLGILNLKFMNLGYVIKIEEFLK